MSEQICKAKEIVVISGKGGTGKTSLTASFAALAKDNVIADCDVDAPDLYLVSEPRLLQKEEFVAGKSAHIQTELCIGCGECSATCNFDAIHLDGPGNGGVEKTCRIDNFACEGCGACTLVCPAKAIELEDNHCGEWFISETRFGPMVHARLAVASENSGKLVTIVRRSARCLAHEREIGLLICDGPPGIGCPVIASVTGADLVVLVTEPSLSGRHDLNRILELTNHFRVPAVICINKYDINLEQTEAIERFAREHQVPVVGKIQYDPIFSHAQAMKCSVVEYSGNAASQQIRSTWRHVLYALG